MAHVAHATPFHPQHYHPGQIRVASGINFLAGLWIIISPWVYGYAYDAGGAWNGVIVGIIIAVLAARRFGGHASPGVSWVNFILGLWMIISPWVYGYAANEGWKWNSIILGIIVAVLGIWSARAGRAEPDMPPVA